MDAVSLILERKDRLELILTNAHRTKANGSVIIELIEKEFRLKIILMSPDDIKDVSRGSGTGTRVSVYLMESLSVSEINDLWSNALAREKRKREVAAADGGGERHKRTREMGGDGKDEPNVEKKPRVVWTKEMHQKFLEAVAQLGHDKAFPKKIVELMNVPGLTRENVASHLQKYRMCMKRAQEGFMGSLYGLNLVNDLSAPFGFDPLRGNLQRSNWNPLGSRRDFGFNLYGSRFKLSEPTMCNDGFTPQDVSFLDEARFRVYGDDTRNVLFSVESRAPTKNTGFIGFRLTGDAKSLAFGQNGHFGEDEKSSAFGQNGHFGEDENRMQYPLESSVGFDSQLHDCLPELENDYSTPCASFPYSFPQLQQSLGQIGNEDSTRCPLLSQMGNDSSTPCLSFAVGFTQQQDSILQVGNDHSTPCPLFPVTFTPQQQDSLDHCSPCPSFPVTFTPQPHDSLLEMGNDRSSPCSPFPATFTPRQQDSHPEMGNDHSAPCSSFPLGLTPQQQPPVTNWDQLASFIPQQQDFLPQMGNDHSSPCLSFPVSFTPQPQSSATPVPGADQNKPVSFTENDGNAANSEILSDFTSLPVPPIGFSEGDDGGGVSLIEKAARCLFDEDFDDLLFGREDLTF